MEPVHKKPTTYDPETMVRHRQRFWYEQYENNDAPKEEWQKRLEAWKQATADWEKRS